MKRVPIENDYENLLKEIQHMKQCQSEHIVKCFGSYYFGGELWVRNRFVFLARVRAYTCNTTHACARVQIAMENCSAGSAADVMKVCRCVARAHSSLCFFFRVNVF